MRRRVKHSLKCVGRDYFIIEFVFNKMHTEQNDEFDVLDLDSISRTAQGDNLDNSGTFKPAKANNFGFQRTQTRNRLQEPEYIGKWRNLSAEDIDRLNKNDDGSAVVTGRNSIGRVIGGKE